MHLSVNKDWHENDKCRARKNFYCDEIQCYITNDSYYNRFNSFKKLTNYICIGFFSYVYSHTFFRIRYLLWFYLCWRRTLCLNFVDVVPLWNLKLGNKSLLNVSEITIFIYSIDRILSDNKFIFFFEYFCHNFVR